MANSFLGLNTALSGLFANQQALSVVSHNVANANTEGYSRQTVDMEAYRADVLASGQGTIGTGVSVNAVEQIRDEYLDYKLRAESSELANAEAKYEIFSIVEYIFNEPSDSSIATVLDDYYSSLNDLTANSEDLTARALVRQNAIALTESISSITTSLTDLQEDLNYSVETNVNAVNSYAEQIADLNKVIYEIELAGGTANDARDQRNLLLDQMSEIVDIDYYEDSESHFNVSIGGHNIVSHYRSETINLVEREESINEYDSDSIMDMEWDDGNPVIISDGELKGLIDMRDSAEGDTKGIPYYINMMNEFADGFANEFNEIHSSGYGLDGSTGVFMFTMDDMTTDEYKEYLKTSGLDGGAGADVTSAVLSGTDSSYTDEENEDIIADNIAALKENNPSYQDKSVVNVDGEYLVVDTMDASRMTVAADLEDLNLIAAAIDKEDLPGDGLNITELLNTRHDIELFDWGSPEDFITSLVANLGVDTNSMSNVVDSQTALVDSLELSRESVMGVSIDEEMSLMIQYQTVYSACATMTQTFNDMLDTLINVVGA